MIVFSALLTFFYVALILFYFTGWIRIPYFTNRPSSHQVSYSILVPARNEAQSIEKCIRDILQQTYPSHLYELIIIDDHSTDDTSAVVQKIIDAGGPVKITLLHMKNDSEQRKLKKAAITFGIAHAAGQYIILTDADCERGPKWLETIDAFILFSKAKMVYAPVMFKAKNSFEKIQSLEFAGLVGIGGAAIELKKPNMCSAANLIFEKQTFYDVKGYWGNENIASGDDEYLMHKVSKAYPGYVRFLKNKEAIVTTGANNSVMELVNQRKRWVSKSTKYENHYITAILVAAYLFNAGIVYHLIFNFYFGLSILLAKTITEGIFLYSVLKFLNRKKYILLLPLAEPFHILYVLIIGIWANTGTYNWKGRAIKPIKL